MQDARADANGKERRLFDGNGILWPQVQSVRQAQGAQRKEHSATLFGQRARE